MRKIAFVFSGQGAQYTGMGRELYDNCECVRKTFEEVDNALERSISDICFYGTDEELGKTINTQPCVFTVDLAIAKALEDNGIRPEGVAGFSLGEYAALCMANVLSIEEAAVLVQKRAHAMQDAVPEGRGAMAAIIGKNADEVADICASVKSGYAAISNYNSPQQIVIAGETAAIDEALKLVEENGGRGVRLAVSVPSHCMLMEPAGNTMKKVLDDFTMTIPEKQIYFNYSGNICDDLEKMKIMMIKQLQYPVKWTQTIEKMYEDGFNVFIECGPGKTLLGIIKKILKGKDVEVYHVEDLPTLEKVVGVLSE